jgi:hypothetical protein
MMANLKRRKLLFKAKTQPANSNRLGEDDTTKKTFFSHMQLAMWMRVIHVANGSPRGVSDLGLAWLIRLSLNDN